MKRCSLFLIVIFLVSVASSFQRINGQDNTKEDRENDKMIQKQIDEQKKAMADLKKAQAEAEQALSEKKLELDKKIFDIQVNVADSDSNSNRIFRKFPRGNRSFYFNEPFEFSGPEMQAFIGHSLGGDSERTTWDFSKTIKEKTFSRDYTFDVEKTSNTVVMTVMGDCKSGEIRIKIVMPNGKSYSDILIDESGNLNWRKSFTISDKENQDKAGEWKFQISSAKATGFFKISLQAY